MIWTISELHLVDRESFRRLAGGKAREDLNTLFKRFGIKEVILEAPQMERRNARPVQKLLYHYRIAKRWGKIIEQVKPGDALVLQFPPINHTLLLAPILKKTKKKNIRLIAFIHDLEILRHSRNNQLPASEKWRLKREELDELKLFDVLIVHNEHMKEYLHNELGIQESVMFSLEMFDYLVSEDFRPSDETACKGGCIIAGNLNREKSGFVYQLPGKPDFELYGVNYEAGQQENIHYHGAFLPEKLPNHLSGSFGLVWDGDSAGTCSGMWGEYLRYNNPHKTSLYLACGFPVITWKEAAIADFISKHDVGITVGSLEELDGAIRALTPERYRTLKKNAEILSEKVRSGYFTKRAWEAAQDRCARG